MATFAAARSGSANLVALEYDDLVAGVDLTAQIGKAFSEESSLGILTVVNIPGLAEKRQALLPLANRFARLPADMKERYEVPEAFYNCGWSHGREKLQGKPDYAKGSYYANPLYDRPVDDEELIEKFASFVAPNVWPSEALPALEPAFKELGRVMVEVGALVAKQCDSHVAKLCPGYTHRKLETVIRTSKCCKGRLLHYFAKDSADAHPPAPASDDSTDASATAAGSAAASTSLAAAVASSANSDSSSSRSNSSADSSEASSEASSEPSSPKSSPEEGSPLSTTLEKDDEDLRFSDWCGWHNDHGSLTSLVPAMYLDQDGNEIACPDPAAGLYVRSRTGELVKVAFPKNGGRNLLFQIGETAQIHTGGLLQATPHAVRGADGCPGVTRETFAVFMEPNWDGDMDVPDGRTGAEAQTQKAAAALPVGVPPLGKRWAEGMDFGEFTEATFSEFY
jgi:isopenicillin N synthase-like dioxygenase